MRIKRNPLRNNFDKFIWKGFHHLKIKSKILAFIIVTACILH